MFGLVSLVSGRNSRHTPQMRRRLLLIRLGLIVPLLVAVFVLHLSGTDLVVLRVVRIVLLIGVIVVFRGLGRERNAASRDGVSDSTEPR